MTQTRLSLLALARAIVQVKIARWRLTLARWRLTLARRIIWLSLIGYSWAIPTPVLHWAAENALEKKEPRP